MKQDNLKHSMQSLNMLKHRGLIEFASFAFHDIAIWVILVVALNLIIYGSAITFV